jgi:hypothetical protein
MDAVTRFLREWPESSSNRFELYVTDKGEQALDNAWPLFSADAARSGADHPECWQTKPATNGAAR